MSFQSRKIGAESLLNFRRPQAAAPSTADSLLPVLIVLHKETSTPGRVGNVLRALGHGLDIRRPRFGDPLPETLDGHAGAVIFGGPIGPNQTAGPTAWPNRLYANFVAKKPACTQAGIFSGIASKRSVVTDTARR